MADFLDARQAIMLPRSIWRGLYRPIVAPWSLWSPFSRPAHARGKCDGLPRVAPALWEHRLNALQLTLARRLGRDGI